MCACVNPKRSPVFQSPRPASRCSSYLPSLYLVRFPDRSAARPDPNQIRPLFPAQICAPNPTPASHPPPPLYPSPVAHILQSENRQLFPPSPIACTPSRQLCGATVPNATRVRRPSFTTNPPFQFSGNPWPVPQLPCPPTALLGRQPLAAYVSSLPTPPIDRRPPRPILSENPASRPPP